MFKMKAFIFLVLCLFAAAEAYKSYEGYKVYKVIATTNEQFQLLKELQDDNGYDFWNDINTIQLPINIMVAPAFQDDFETLLFGNGIDYTIAHSNVEEIVERERTAQKVADLQLTRSSGRISFTHYLRHAEINQYLDELAASYPNITRVQSIGLSYENRTIKSITISSTPDSARKPVIFVDAGIHAREWIAPAVALYLIHQLVENSTNYGLSANVTWVIIPTINPDGYEYTHTTARFWRKTRSPGYVCYGTDANRNMDFHWLEIGASNNECSETFAGTAPNSEVESRVLDAYFNSINRHIALYLTIHSYGQYILYPWGWTLDLPPNAAELDLLGNNVNNAIRNVSGTNYVVGNSGRVLYATSGSTQDWAYGVKSVPLSYTIELPGGGNQGFDLPPSRIEAVARETFEGLRVFQSHINGKK